MLNEVQPDVRELLRGVVGELKRKSERTQMKQAFQIFKARPQITVVLTRDSVCAGDDCDARHV